MPIVSLDLSSIIAATGWTGATTANLTTSNDVRATGGTAGELISAELGNVPADYNSLNTVTLKVEARTLGTVSRAKSITLELRDATDTILETFSTPSITGTDAVYSSTALVRAATLTEANAWRLRATVTEGSGMADSASVEIDRMWVEIDYSLAPTFLASWARGSNRGIGIIVQ